MSREQNGQGSDDSGPVVTAEFTAAEVRRLRYLVGDWNPQEDEPRAERAALLNRLRTLETEASR